MKKDDPFPGYGPEEVLDAWETVLQRGQPPIRATIDALPAGPVRLFLWRLWRVPFSRWLMFVIFWAFFAPVLYALSALALLIGSDISDGKATMFAWTWGLIFAVGFVLSLGRLVERYSLIDK